MKTMVIAAAGRVVDDLSGLACFILCMIWAGASLALYAFIWFNYMIINLVGTLGN